MKDIFSLAGKSLLVTGASSGIGRQIAITAAEFGATVNLVGRNKERLDETLSLMTKGDHQLTVADLTKREDLKSLTMGKTFDGVVFNAGVVEYTPVKFISEEKIKNIFDTNFNSTVLLCQQLLKNKSINKKGSLVFISSISSKLGVGGTALYASSKAAVGAFSKVVASEVAALGIRSNSVSPGIVITPMSEQARTTRLVLKWMRVKSYPLGYGSTPDVFRINVPFISIQ